MSSIESSQLFMCEKETLVSMIEELRKKNEDLLKADRVLADEVKYQTNFFHGIIDYITGDYKKAKTVEDGIQEHYTMDFIDGNMEEFEKLGLFENGVQWDEDFENDIWRRKPWRKCADPSKYFLPSRK